MKVIRFRFTPFYRRFYCMLYIFLPQEQTKWHEIKSSFTKDDWWSLVGQLNLVTATTLISSEFCCKTISNVTTAKSQRRALNFYVKGNKTVRISSTNTVCYITMHLEIKAKLLKEITLCWIDVQTIFREVHSWWGWEFFYVRRCWHESIRLQPPFPVFTIIHYEECQYQQHLIQS